jgi:predicted amidohydrolase
MMGEKLIAAGQLAPCWGDPDRTLFKVRRMAAEAADAGAVLLALPEQVLTGWNPLQAQFLEEEEDGPLVGALQEIAAEHHIGLLGSVQQKADPMPTNTAVMIDADGTVLTRYTKMHPFSPGGEDLHYAGGTGINTFSMAGLRFGIAICYDLRFGDLFVRYAEAGVDAMLVPAAWPCSRIEHWERFLRMRAKEQGYYLIGINTAAVTTPIDRYCGHSMIVDPSGTVLASADGTEQVLYATVDPAMVCSAVQHDRLTTSGR